MSRVEKALLRLHSKKDRAGFTLIELVVVVVIIGILTAIAIPSYGAIQDTARHNTLKGVAQTTYKEATTKIAQNESFFSVVDKYNSSDSDFAVSIGVIGEDRIRVNAYLKSDPTVMEVVITP